MSIKKIEILILVSCIIFSSCKRESESSSSLFEIVSSKQTNINFKNRIPVFKSFSVSGNNLPFTQGINFLILVTARVTTKSNCPSTSSALLWYAFTWRQLFRCRYAEYRGLSNGYTENRFGRCICRVISLSVSIERYLLKTRFNERLFRKLRRNEQRLVGRWSQRVY